MKMPVLPLTVATARVVIARHLSTLRESHPDRNVKPDARITNSCLRDSSNGEEGKRGRVCVS